MNQIVSIMNTTMYFKKNKNLLIACDLMQEMIDIYNNITVINI
jgi:hypothetical protein